MARIHWMQRAEPNEPQGVYKGQLRLHQHMSKRQNYNPTNPPAKRMKQSPIVVEVRDKVEQESRTMREVISKRGVCTAIAMLYSGGKPGRTQISESENTTRICPAGHKYLRILETPSNLSGPRKKPCPQPSAAGNGGKTSAVAVSRLADPAYDISAMHKQLLGSNVYRVAHKTHEEVYDEIVKAARVKKPTHYYEWKPNTPLLVSTRLL